MNGQRANWSGAHLRHLISASLEFADIPFTPNYLPGFLDLYGKQAERIAFFCHSARGYVGGLYIQCARQDVGGTAERKLLYTRESIERLYDKPTVLVLSGSALDHAKDFLETQVSERLIGVYDMAQFMLFAESISYRDIGVAVTEAFRPKQTKFPFE